VRERIAEYLDESVRRRALSQYVSVLTGLARVTGVDLAGSGPLVQ
jgi:peptidyl-prolyl cis-trans isomerase C